MKIMTGRAEFASFLDSPQGATGWFRMRRCTLASVSLLVFFCSQLASHQSSRPWALFWSRESLSQRAYLKDAMAECLLAGLLAAAASRELPLLLVPEKGDPGGCCLDGGWWRVMKLPPPGWTDGRLRGCCCWGCRTKVGFRFQRAEVIQKFKNHHQGQLL